MYIVEMNDNRALIIADAARVEILPEVQSVIFLNIQSEIVAGYKLSEIKGFHKSGKPQTAWAIPGNDMIAYF